jgi:hypothetical protein
MIRPMHARATSLASALLIAMTVALGACQKPHTPQLSDRFEAVSEDAREDVLAVQLREMAVEFAALVEEAADDIMDATDDEEMRRNALLWKMHAIPASRLALLHVEAVVGLIDGWILFVQMREFFDDGEGRDMFGEHQPMVIDVCRRLEESMANIARGISKDETVFDDWQRRVAQWAADAALDDLHFESHAAWVNDYADVMTDELSVVDTIVSLEELAFDVSQRLNIYVSDLPRHARWQVEYAITEFMKSARVRALEANIAKLQSLGELEEMKASLDRMAVQLDALTAAVDQVPDIVSGERTHIVEMFQTELDEVLEAVSAERVAVQETITAERAEAFAEVDRQRSETIEEITRLVAEQRALIIEELDRMTNTSIAAAESQLEAVVDHAFFRLVQLLVVLALLAAFVILVRRRFGPAS